MDKQAVVRFRVALKLGLLVSLLTVTVAAIALAVFYTFTRHAILQEMEGRLKDVAHTGSYMFDEADRRMIMQVRDAVMAHTRHLTPQVLKIKPDDTRPSLTPAESKKIEDTVQYQTLVQLLRRIQQGSSSAVQPMGHLKQDGGHGPHPPNILWAYLMVPIPQSPDHRIVMLLVDSNYESIDYNHDGKIEGIEQGDPAGNLYAGDHAIFGKPFEDGEMHVSKGWYTDSWGTVMSAVVPIKDASGHVEATLGLDYLVNSQSHRLKQIMYISIAILIGSIVLAILFSVLLAWMINRPLRKLSMGAQRLAGRNYQYPIEVRSNDEFGLLADTLNKMAVQVKNYQQGLEKLVDERTQELGEANQEILRLYESIRQENQNLGQELGGVRRLQMALLPQKAELARFDRLDMAFYMDPASQVGGDYLDMIAASKGRFWLGVGDVSGHGLESALSTLAVRTAIRALLNGGDNSLVETYARVARAAYTQLRTATAPQHMTLNLLEYDGNASFTLTGQHEDALVVRDGNNLEVLDTFSLGLPLGLVPDLAEYLQPLTVRLNPGQLLCLYTNGLTELCNDQGEIFGQERLGELLRANYREPAQKVQQRLVEALEAFRGEQPIEDDISFVIIKLVR